MKKLIFFALLIWGCFTLFKKCSCTSCSSQKNKTEEVQSSEDVEKTSTNNATLASSTSAVQSQKDYGNNYKQAVKDGDFEAAHEILERCYSDDAMVYINFYEISSLLEEGGDGVVDKVIYILNEVPVKGEIQKGICDYFYASEILNSRNACIYETEAATARTYISFCKKYNELCDKVINLAINRKNKQVAEAVLDFYKPDIKVYKGESWGIKIDGVNVDGNHGYIKLYKETKAEAAEKVRKAFRMGKVKK